MDGFNWEVPVKVSINMDNVQLEHGILHKRLEWFDVTEFVKEYIKTRLLKKTLINVQNFLEKRFECSMIYTRTINFWIIKSPTSSSTFDDEVVFVISSRIGFIFSAIEFIFKCNNVDLDVDDDKVIVDFAEVAHGSGVGANVGDEVAPIEVEYKDDINKKELIEDKVRIIAIAHMDDATLISNSREAVKAQQKRLEIYEKIGRRYWTALCFAETAASEKFPTDRNGQFPNHKIKGDNIRIEELFKYE
ncbi:hypothetical protein RIR_jg38910.t1 [Rhizophagus irregularis DAOM 181602=DAOM 197198]|nr:hypothetical protein RIR_jg38910.t1 [Rhizophagus irregularis DAOM 181602=DAOM 197198]